MTTGVDEEAVMASGRKDRKSTRKVKVVEVKKKVKQSSNMTMQIKNEVKTIFQWLFQWSQWETWLFGLLDI